MITEPKVGTIFNDQEFKAIKRVLKSGDFLTRGRDVELFEKEFVAKMKDVKKDLLVHKRCDKILDRSEVEADAEVIIGAITDEALSGKIRVSIVATSLDGQQPERKSVINMVHRIQNRNTGYSDFSNLGPTPSFNFTSGNLNPVSHGANALKVDSEVTSEMINQTSAKEDINHVNDQYHQELLKNQNAESIIENSSTEKEISFTQEAMHEENSNIEQELKNDLSEFGVEPSAPDLFNNDIESSNSDELLSSDGEDDQEDDLEIPAFLRRQKN